MSKIVKSRAMIEIETDSGYSSKNLLNNEYVEKTGTHPLRGALMEIIRLLTLNGEGQEALEIANSTFDETQRDLESEYLEDEDEDEK